MSKIICMIIEWKKRDACWTNIGSPDLVREQKYTLLSNRENLALDGRKPPKESIGVMANKRLNTAYLLKESFGQLWSYQTEGWARKFFDNWNESLKWQRLKPYEKFSNLSSWKRGNDRETLGWHCSIQQA